MKSKKVLQKYLFQSSGYSIGEYVYLLQKHSQRWLQNNYTSELSFGLDPGLIQQICQ
jgi:hypothetical protein